MAKKYLVMCSLIIGLFIVLIGCNTQTEQVSSESSDTSSKPTSLLIGTGSEGGSYFYVGSGIADVVNKNMSNVKVTAQSTAGGVENLRRVSSGDMDFGIFTSSDLAITLEDETVDLSKIKLLTAGHVNIRHIVVREDSGITSMDELFVKGRKIGTGAPGSAIVTEAETYLDIYGLTFDDIEEAPLSSSEQANALKDNNIDGAILVGGIPTASLSDVSTSIDVKVLPATDEFIEKFKQYQPDAFPINIPGGTYRGMEEEFQTFGSAAFIAVRADIEEQLIYEFLKAIQENTDEIAKIHPTGSEYTVENSFRGADYLVKDLELKYHPGAVKWYEEKNAWTGEYQ
nr:TAXI family TRAP transporter solute-binding subunit [Fredinandcohnia onubensis]